MSEGKSLKVVKRGDVTVLPAPATRFPLALAAKFEVMAPPLESS